MRKIITNYSIQMVYLWIQSKPVAMKHNVTVCYSREETHIPVFVDITLFHGVFLNLILNAVEHVADLEDEMQKTVDIQVHSTGKKVSVSIRNMGEPILQERLATFFEKFNSDRKKKSGGMGLGTTYAYLVTRAHG